MELYNVTLDNKIVGNVCVTCSGLYTLFRCRCRLPSNEMFRLFMNCSDQTFDLGICVPEESGFVLNKKMQTKQIPVGEKDFYLAVDSQCHNKNVIPVSSDIPFSNLSMLENAYLYRKYNNYGIVLKDQPKSK